MAVIKMIDSEQLEADLESVADAIREKGETSAGLSFPDGFIAAVEAISTHGIENAIAGTFTPMNHLRSITLSDCAGRDNIFIYPTFDLMSEEPMGRVHWGSLILDGRSILQGSSNVSRNAYVMTATTYASRGWVNNADTYDSSTGTVTIVADVDANYGGSFAAGKTYGYLAW